MKTLFNKEHLINYFAKQKDIEFALLFGSSASGHTNALSDIDIAVYFKETSDSLTAGERQVELTCDIMKLYQINHVDIIVMNTANPFLLFQIVKNGVLLYVKDEKLFYYFKAMTLGNYQDIKPMYDMYENKSIEHLRNGIYGR
jgi:predicted nucleotidyltransferase